MKTGTVLTLTASLFALVASAVPAAAQSLLTNGGFEAPSGYFNTYTGTQIPGWRVTVNSVDIASNAIYGSSSYAFEGTQWLDLIGNGTTGAIAQTFATSIGSAYVLSFAYGNNPDYGSAAASVAVSGASTVLASVLTHAGSSRTAANWTSYSQSFIADAANTTVTFTDTSHNQNAGIYLDAVAVVPLVTGTVPEPATWALLLTGFAAVGVSMRRRAKAAMGFAAQGLSQSKYSGW